MGNKAKPVVEEAKLRCEYCNISLINIVINQTNEERKDLGIPPQLAVFYANCPKCGQFTEKTKKFEGTTNILHSSKDIIIEDVDVDIEDDGTILSNIKLSLNNK